MERLGQNIRKNALKMERPGRQIDRKYVKCIEHGTSWPEIVHFLGLEADIDNFIISSETEDDRALGEAWSKNG